MARAPLVEPRNVADDLRDVTRKAGTLDNLVISSSVSPSAKYALSASALRLRKGSIAIERERAGAVAVAGSSAIAVATRRFRQASISDLTANTLARERCMWR